MTIKKLPPHIINRLKAGEIVERPSAVLKELLENALDAGATECTVSLEKGGKKKIRLEDNGLGVADDDLLLTVERYATSKIQTDYDLESIESYGFRGEALASIGEVSTVVIQTRNVDTTLPTGVGHELWKDGGAYKTKNIAVGFEHGTIVSVADLFQGVPARLKFLKADATERNYCKQVFLSFCLIHRNKSFTLVHNGKTVYSLRDHASLFERLEAIYTKDRAGKWQPIERSDENVHIYGVVGDASLHFASQQYVQLFVNNRPVQDRLLKKALMDAYERQIVPGTYPFAHIFIEVNPKLVDVNVHPRKLEVKFLDPGSIYTRVKETIKEHLGSKRVNYAAFTKHHMQPQQNRSVFAQNRGGSTDGSIEQENTVQQDGLFGAGVENASQVNIPMHTGATDEYAIIDFAGEDVVILGQLRDSYIVAQGAENVYYIDQHALAERITFEKMKRAHAEKGYSMEVLLSPITVSFPNNVEIDEIIDLLSSIGFDCSLFGEQRIIFYALPALFVEYSVDLEAVMQWVWSNSDEIDEYKKDPKEFFTLLVDEIVGMKACKASIKAGQPLHYHEMRQLLLDGLEHTDGLFVCQHGRPSVVKVEKRYVDALFDR